MPLSLAPDWTGWSGTLAAAADVDELAAGLLLVAADIAPYLGRGEISRRQWKRLGVHAVAVPMSAGGGCRRDGGELVVFVNEGEDPRRQRFTVAHELGHLLLDEARARLRLRRATEEWLCNAFASELVVPRADLEAELNERGNRLDPDEVIALCNRFAVSVQPIMIALRDYVADDQVHVVAREAGHPRRPEIVDLRFHAATARTIYLPRHQRLRSAGLSALSDWARAARGGRQRGGDVATFELRGAQPPLSGVARGPVSWSARLLPNRLLLASLDVAEMRFHWREPDAELAA